MVITPTMTYASGTWTLTQTHGKMINTAQRKMLRVILQTKRKYKTKKKAASKRDEEPEVTQDKKATRTFLKETLRVNRKKIQTKFRTVMYLSRKKRTKKLMPLTPNSWRKIRIQVIQDREDPGNYRPICGLPILYTLFATVLYARLAPSLHKVQPPDQAGFRPNHRCEDHLTVYRILEQRRRE